jgi:mannose-6-phosphate isomerase-like protein (cupin superfamily)
MAWSVIAASLVGCAPIVAARTHGGIRVRPSTACGFPGSTLAPMEPVEIQAVQEELSASGGYRIVHTSPGLELGVYALVAPEPDRQQPHDRDEVYVVLDGRGTLRIEGDSLDLTTGQAAFVPAGADHRFTGYEGLSVLVIFAGEPS